MTPYPSTDLLRLCTLCALPGHMTLTEVDTGAAAARIVVSLCARCVSAPRDALQALAFYVALGEVDAYVDAATAAALARNAGPGRTAAIVRRAVVEADPVSRARFKRRLGVLVAELERIGAELAGP